jgi:hypothetical protein
MGCVTHESMRQFLSKSYSSVNENKLHGLLAEIDFRNYLRSIGFSDRVSVGGWIARCTGPGQFGKNVLVMFPETIQPNVEYSPDRLLPNPSHGLHTICATFHQIGIRSYYCSPIIRKNDPAAIIWKAVELGLPTQQKYIDFPKDIKGFNVRTRGYNFLRYKSDVSVIPSESIAEEFSKEDIRVTFQNHFMGELSDIDGILWGQQYTYPLEIKEKTSAPDRGMGEFFGIDVGPFVKLSFYAAKRGNLHSIFVVREIDNPETRRLVKWWFITFEKMAQYAGWTPIAGGMNMRGGGSSVIKIPKSEFTELDKKSIEAL